MITKSSANRKSFVKIKRGKERKEREKKRKGKEKKGKRKEREKIS
jgi:hypothetical protein